MRLKGCVVLLFLLFLQTVGVCIFLSGFLLKRTVLPDISVCRDGSKHSGCLLPKRHSRAILLIIDALRFDFVVNDVDQDPELLPPYKNKLPVIEDTVLSHPENARLYKFVADPPTTTMQRLKGLTTGSLPTFVDAGSNFASSSITEDNWLLQAGKLNKSIYFMGDDTWLQLFPDAFSRSWPFPSLNVKDLHTVDNGVLEHLVPQIKSGNWDILIGHFLGVDHCGHRFGPYHSAISDKLQQMDAMVRSVMAELADDTVLMVFGDHGMTRSGDHGGDSTDEVSSALFVYSPRPMVSSTALAGNEGNTHGSYKTVSQVDLVPTLSMLLGFPIPFNNLGQVITDLFGQRVYGQEGSTRNLDSPVRTLSDDDTIVALLENAKQVDEYLRTYSATSSDLPSAELQKLTEYLRDVQSKLLLSSSPSSRNTHEDRQYFVAALQSYLSDAQALCRQVWAKFDVPVMLFGIVQLVGCALLAFLSALYVGVQRSGIAIQLSRVRFAAVFIPTAILVSSAYGSLRGLNAVSVVSSLVLAASVASIGVLLPCLGTLSSCVRTERLSFHRLPELCAGVFLIGHFLAFMSNSFVVQEDSLLLVFGQMLLVATWLAGRHHADSSSSTSVRSTSEHSMTVPSGWCLIASLVLCRIPVIFRGCREEQSWCQPSSFLLHSSTTFGHIGFGPAMLRLVSSCCIVLAVPVVMSVIGMQKQQQKHYPVFTLQIALLFAAAAFVCLHFCLQSLPLRILDTLYAWQHVVLPRMAYGLTGVVVLHVWARSDLSSAKTLTQGIHSIIVAVWMVLTMLLGDGLVYASCTMLMALLSTSQLLSITTSDRPWAKAAVWAGLSGQFFFATGHQCDLPSIRFDAAFVGLHGDQQGFIAAGALVIGNMFASQVLFTLAIPLTSRRLCGGSSPVKQESMESQDADVGHERQVAASDELGVVTNETDSVIFYYVFYHNVTLIGAAVAATVLRRHLMVWKIFAPRLLYMAVSAELACITGLVVFLMLPHSLPSSTSKKSLHGAARNKLL